MRKRLVLGDIHGHDEFVCDIYNKELPDDIIILGDYCDSFTKTSKEIKLCWDTLLDMKEHHKNGEFHLLIGNHDLHYLYTSEQYSGKKKQTEDLMHNVLMEAWENGILEPWFVDEKNKTIYSHAGITKTWIEDYGYNLKSKPSLYSLCFTYGNSFDVYGDDPANGPVWVRPYSLSKDCLDNYKQVVGHTITQEPIIVADDGTRIMYDNIDKVNSDGRIIILDTLPFFYMIEKIDNNGNIVKREFKKFREFNSRYRQ